MLSVDVTIRGERGSGKSTLADAIEEVIRNHRLPVSGTIREYSVVSGAILHSDQDTVINPGDWQ